MLDVSKKCNCWHCYGLLYNYYYSRKYRLNQNPWNTAQHRLDIGLLFFAPSPASLSLNGKFSSHHNVLVLLRSSPQPHSHYNIISSGFYLSEVTASHANYHIVTKMTYYVLKSYLLSIQKIFSIQDKLIPLT